MPYKKIVEKENLGERKMKLLLRSVQLRSIDKIQSLSSVLMLKVGHNNLTLSFLAAKGKRSKVSIRFIMSLRLKPICCLGEAYIFLLLIHEEISLQGHYNTDTM